jgi:anti-anti-sigma regulatory factor
MSDPAVFTLPARISVTSDTALVAFLAASRGHDTVIQAGALRRLDALLLQVLLAAAADRRAAGVRFRVTGLAPALADQATDLGLTPDLLTIEVSA